jgi:hypothetical protein
MLVWYYGSGSVKVSDRESIETEGTGANNIPRNWKFFGESGNIFQCRANSNFPEVLIQHTFEQNP